MEARRKLTELAVRQASRRRRIVADKTRRRDNHRHIEEQVIQRREDLDTIRAARKRQREDLALGPLKPWRDEYALRDHIDKDPITGEVVHARKANAEWGTYSTQKYQKPQLPEHMKLVRRELILREGDRVAIKHRAKGVREQSWGKIGFIKDIHCNTGFVTISTVNMIDLEVPEAARQPGEEPVKSVEEPVPYSALELIYPLPHQERVPDRDPDTKEIKVDPKTNKPKFKPITVPKDTRIDISAMSLSHAFPNEVLSEEEEKNAYTYERDAHDISFKFAHKYNTYFFPHPSSSASGPKHRYILPQRLRIPWPKTDDRPSQDREDDTQASFAETRSFTPTLLRPPMPEGVIDELRNKTSKFRKRHDEEYVAKMEAVDADMAEQAKRTRQLKAQGARNIARGERAGIVKAKLARQVKKEGLALNANANGTEKGAETGAVEPGSDVDAAEQSEVVDAGEQAAIVEEAAAESSAGTTEPESDLDTEEQTTITSAPPSQPKKQGLSKNKKRRLRPKGPSPEERSKRDRTTGVDSRILEMLGQHIAAKRGLASSKGGSRLSISPLAPGETVGRTSARL